MHRHHSTLVTAQAKSVRMSCQAEGQGKAYSWLGNDDAVTLLFEVEAVHLGDEASPDVGVNLLIPGQSQAPLAHAQPERTHVNSTSRSFLRPSFTQVSAIWRMLATLSKPCASFLVAKMTTSGFAGFSM